MDKTFLQKFEIDGKRLPDEVIADILEQAGAELEAAQQVHRAELQAIRFDEAVREAVGAAKGKNLTAVRALLDLDALRADPTGLGAAVAQVKLDAPYLFDEEQTPPPYAAGTGGFSPQRTYSMEELAGMPMEQYRAYREGL